MGLVGREQQQKNLPLRIQKGASQRAAATLPLRIQEDFLRGGAGVPFLSAADAYSLGMCVLLL